MAVTAGSAYVPQSVSGVPAPKLRIAVPALSATLHDGFVATFPHPPEVVLSELPDRLFDPAVEAELRLFRYARRRGGGQQQAQYAKPAHWAACRHVEAGVNPYDSSQWLGGSYHDGLDRQARELLAGYAYGDTIPLGGLVAAQMWTHRTTAAWTDAATVTVQPYVSSTWVRESNPTRSHGFNAVTGPSRFAVGYIGKVEGRWVLLSGLSRFLIGPTVHPWQLDPTHPDSAPPVQRIFQPNPNYLPLILGARLTDSEWLP